MLKKYMGLRKLLILLLNNSVCRKKLKLFPMNPKKLNKLHLQNQNKDQLNLKLSAHKEQSPTNKFKTLPQVLYFTASVELLSILQPSQLKEKPEDHPQKAKLPGT
tara:strand:- start:87 stop:401 length:315 start_codon:yes stop_codon:yes gene_type:complete